MWYLYHIMWYKHQCIHNGTDNGKMFCTCFIVKKLKFFAKIGLVVQRKDFRTPFDAIMIYTKQSTPLAVENSEMLVIGLSLK